MIQSHALPLLFLLLHHLLASWWCVIPIPASLETRSQAGMGGFVRVPLVTPSRWSDDCLHSLSPLSPRAPGKEAAVHFFSVVSHLGFYPLLSVSQSVRSLVPHRFFSYFLEKKYLAAHFTLEDFSHNIRSSNIRADLGALVSPFHSERTQSHSDFLRPQLFWVFLGRSDLRFP